MISSNKSITLAIMLAAIGSLVIAGVSAATVNADINNPKGDIKFQNTKTVVVNIKGGKDGVNGHDGKDGTNGVNGVDGKDGVNGLNGTNGVDGVNGLNGMNGTNGQDGAPGKDGVNGTNGVDGQNGRDGVNGTNGINGVDGRDAQATILLNVSNGQQIVCTVGAGANDIGCIDVNDNGTVVIPPVSNETGNGTGTGGNTTEPVVCGENETNVNGTCVANLPPIEDNGTVVIPPVTNETTTNTTTVETNTTTTETNSTG